MADGLDDFDLLIVPGHGNSGPDHWQAHWACLYPQSVRVAQDEWLAPTLPDWMARLDAYLALSARPAVLVTHSLACVLLAHWAARHRRGRVAGALIVAPADVERDDLPVAIDASFRPIPLERMPFPSSVVASRNDPFCSFARAQHFAEAWGATLVDAGALDHINSAMKLGFWPFGQAALAQLIQKISEERS